MHFRNLLIVSLFSFITLIQSCRFSNKRYDEANPSSIPFAKLLDSARDSHMEFDVFDSNSMNLIGSETWNFQQSIYFQDLKTYPFMSYLVFRQFKYDSAGGSFTIMNPENLGYALIREFGKQRNMNFLDGRYPNWTPQDSLSSFYLSELPGGNKSIRTTTYKGVTQVDYKGNMLKVHRAERDSSAIEGISPPFFTKKESYYFNDELGLIYMEESRYLQKFGSDSLIYSIVKYRK